MVLLKKKVLLTEYQHEFEQGMLKHVHDPKNEMREKGWTQRDIPPEVHQPSFLRGDESDAQLGFKFEWESKLWSERTKIISTYILKKNLDAIIMYKDKS